MEENREDDQKSTGKDSTDDMDLLVLTFRSLDPWKTKQKDFLDSNTENRVQSQDVSKEPPRSPSQSKQGHREEDETRELRTITLDEVAWHDTADDCWIVIYDFVYDCTDFLTSHPGGSDVILEYAGRDATLPFVGTGHSNATRRRLVRFLIGELPPEERIFRVPDGVKVPEF